jgi:hypothetical protein
MTPEDQECTELVEQMDAFFRHAAKEKITIDLARLHEIFLQHVTVTRDLVVQLMHLARHDPAAVGMLADRLKAAADDAHPGFTRRMSAQDVLGYTLNTMADAYNIVIEPARFPVALPPHLKDHGDSLFALEAGKKH